MKIYSNRVKLLLKKKKKNSYSDILDAFNFINNIYRDRNRKRNFLEWDPRRRRPWWWIHFRSRFYKFAFSKKFNFNKKLIIKKKIKNLKIKCLISNLAPINSFKKLLKTKKFASFKNKKKILNLILFLRKKKLLKKIKFFKSKKSVKVVFRNKKKYSAAFFHGFKIKKNYFKFFTHPHKLVYLFIKKLFLSTIKNGKKEKAFYFLSFCSKNLYKKCRRSFIEVMISIFKKLDSVATMKNAPFLKKGVPMRESFSDNIKLDSRRLKYPVKWIIESAKIRPEKSFAKKLFSELLDIYFARNCETLKKVKEFNRNILFKRSDRKKFNWRRRQKHNFIKFKKKQKNVK